METDDTSRKAVTLRWGSIGAIAVLLALFAIISYSAASSKNATFDEPLHTVGGLLHRSIGEFRLDAEDPPLFGLWASIPNNNRAVAFDFTSPDWTRYTAGEQDRQWGFAMQSLYRNSATNGDAVIQRSRFMFIITGILLGALIAWWSWKLAGAWAAVLATAFFAFDPNFLGHSALVKNDVMVSVLFVAVATGLWRFGQKGSLLSLAVVAICTALAVNVKFSAILLGPIIFTVLLIRALLPQDWTIVGKALNLRWQRLLVVPIACAIVGLVCFITIWASYGFRFAPAADGKSLLKMDVVAQMVQVSRVRERLGPGGVFTSEVSDKEPLGATVNLMLWCESIKILPQAWIYGFTYTYATTIARTSFLMGKDSNTGFLLYFPATMLFKTPTATLLAIPGALFTMGILAALRRRELIDAGRESEVKSMIDWWTLVCLTVPPGIYMLSALTSNMNIGLRHVLPVYPFIFIAMGIGMAMLIARWRIVGGIASGTFLFFLMIETLVAYPDYIPFFNAPSGGSTNGINLLSDSNLDWGQDLKQLGEWQKSRQSKPLYLCYFGVPDPSYYGVRAIHTPGGWPFEAEENKRFPQPNEDCYFAVSATSLQGVYFMPELKQIYRQLNEIHPVKILGGSIYIFELPARDNMIKTPQSQSRR